MRGAIDGLPSPIPLAQRLPGLLVEDDFTRRFTEGLDGGFAPIITTLDALEAYVDPRLAPEDFLTWLAGWVGVELDDAWSLPQRRSIVAEAAEVQRGLGTVSGIARALALALSAEVEVRDNGGCAWSRTPGGALPGERRPALVVVLTVADPAKLTDRRVRDAVAAVAPAHVPRKITVRAR